MPTEKAAGKMMNPAKMATMVSIAATLRWIWQMQRSTLQRFPEKWMHWEKK